MCKLLARRLLLLLRDGDFGNSNMQPGNGYSVMLATLYGLGLSSPTSLILILACYQARNSIMPMFSNSD